MTPDTERAERRIAYLLRALRRIAAASKEGLTAARCADIAQRALAVDAVIAAPVRSEP